jgi:hypothetical protein
MISWTEDLRIEQHLEMAKPVLTQIWLVNGK